MMWFTYSACTLANTDALVRYARIRLRARSKRQPCALRGFYRNSRYSLPFLLRTDPRSSPLFVLVERTQQRIDQPSLQDICNIFQQKITKPKNVQCSKIYRKVVRTVYVRSRVGRDGRDFSSK